METDQYRRTLAEAVQRMKIDQDARKLLAQDGLQSYQDQMKDGWTLHQERMARPAENFLIEQVLPSSLKLHGVRYMCLPHAIANCCEGGWSYLEPG